MLGEASNQLGLIGFPGRGFRSVCNSTCLTLVTTMIGLRCSEKISNKGPSLLCYFCNTNILILWQSIEISNIVKLATFRSLRGYSEILELGMEHFRYGVSFQLSLCTHYTGAAYKPEHVKPSSSQSSSC